MDSSNLHSAKTMQTNHIIGKVLLDELRDISRSIKLYAEKTESISMADRFNRFVHVLNLTGFSGIREYVIALQKLAERIEYDNSNEDYPKAMTLERIRILHAAIAPLGEWMKKFQIGDYQGYDTLKSHRLSVLSKIDQADALFAPVYPSLELGIMWKPIEPDQWSAFAEDTEHLASLLADVPDIIDGKNVVIDPVVLEGFSENAALFKKHNPYFEFAPFFYLYGSLVQQIGLIQAEPVYFFRICLTLLNILNTALSAGSREQVTMPAELMSVLIEFITVQFKKARTENTGDQNLQQSYLKSIASTLKIPFNTPEQTELIARYHESTEKFLEYWNKCAGTGDYAALVKHIINFAKNAHRLDNPIYLLLIQTLQSKIEYVLESKKATYEFWVNGAMALALMESSLAVESQQVIADVELAQLVSDYLARDADINTALPRAVLLSSRYEQLALEKIIKNIIGYTDECERIIVGVLQQQNASTIEAPSEKIAEIKGPFIADMMSRLHGLFDFIGLKQASNNAKQIKEMSRLPNVWIQGEEADHFHQKIVDLALFAKHAQPAYLEDMNGETAFISTDEGDDFVESMDESGLTSDVTAEPQQGEPQHTETSMLTDRSHEVAESDDLLQVFIGEVEGIRAPAQAHFDRYFTEDGQLRLSDEQSFEDDMILLRRFFHTIKGTAYTVGFFHLGDLGYAGQSCLDYLLSVSSEHRTIPVICQTLLLCRRIFVSIESCFDEIVTTGGTFASNDLQALNAYRVEAQGLHEILQSISVVDDNFSEFDQNAPLESATDSTLDTLTEAATESDKYDGGVPASGGTEEVNSESEPPHTILTPVEHGSEMFIASEHNEQIDAMTPPADEAPDELASENGPIVDMMRTHEEGSERENLTAPDEQSSPSAEVVHIDSDEVADREVKDNIEGIHAESDNQAGATTAQSDTSDTSEVDLPEPSAAAVNEFPEEGSTIVSVEDTAPASETVVEVDTTTGTISNQSGPGIALANTMLGENEGEAELASDVQTSFSQVDAGESLPTEENMAEQSLIEEDLPSMFSVDDMSVVISPEQLQQRIQDAIASEVDKLDSNLTMLRIFLDEANSSIETINSVLSDETGMLDDANAETVGRAVHNLKGVLRTVGLFQAGAALHCLEDDLEVATPDVFTPERIDLYRYVADYVGQVLSQVEQVCDIPVQAMPPVAEMPAEVIDHLEVSHAPVHEEQPVEERRIVLPTAVGGEVRLHSETDNTELADKLPLVNQVPENIQSAPVNKDAPQEPWRIVPQASRPEKGAQVRINKNSLDQVEQQISQTVVLQGMASSQIEDTWQAMKGLTANVDRLTTMMTNLQIHSEINMDSGIDRSQSNQQFDALELDRYTSLQEITRSMMEVIEDIRNSEARLSETLSNLEETESIKLALSADLQREASHLMVIPFGSRRAKLEATIRLAAKDSGKLVELEMGGEADISSSVMSVLGVAMDHVVRNAVAHGIELPSVRRQLRKLNKGKIKIQVFHTVEKNIVTIEDDGAGIDAQRILAKARELGLADDREYSDHEAYEMLFQNGFSTASKVSQLSGRGIGLDAVKSMLQDIGGEVFVTSKVGEGTKFRLEVPSDVTTLSVVPVQGGNVTAMVPSALVDRIVHVSSADADSAVAKGTIEIDGVEYRYMRMAWLLSESPMRQPHSFFPLLLSGLQSGVPTAYEVDVIYPYRKVLFRPLGRHISNIPGLIAGTTLADGNPALIINPLRMRAIGKDAAIKDDSPSLPCVMIVDDSPTVRVYTSKFMKKMGFEVVEAKDGIDALEIMRTLTPDLFILDVEMPGMDGFELVKNIKKQAVTKDLPIIMISSRTAQKHREHARELGVNAYLGKPFEEVELKGVIECLSSNQFLGLTSSPP